MTATDLLPETDHAAAPAATPRVRGSGYWTHRQDMMYYKYVMAIAGKLTLRSRSLIDVGSHQTGMSEAFPWIPERVALDIRRPYSSATVTGIQADFLTFEPGRRYDFALCLQVLEHVPEAERFARKLLTVAERVLVSVPYKWPAGACDRHCQDPVDEAKLAGWFGRDPTYQIVVEEPFLPPGPGRGRRLIAYFHPLDRKFKHRSYRRLKSVPADR